MFANLTFAPTSMRTADFVLQDDGARLSWVTHVQKFLSDPSSSIGLQGLKTDLHITFSCGYGLKDLITL